MQAFAGVTLLESFSAPPHGVFCCRRMPNAVAEIAAAFFTDYFAFIEPCSVKLFEIIIAHTFRAFCVLLLNVIKYKTADKSFVVAFDVILWQFSPICTQFFCKIINGILTLKKHIPFVNHVCQNSPYRGALPCSLARYCAYPLKCPPMSRQKNQEL